MARRLPLVENRSAVHEPCPPRPPGWGVAGVPALVDAQGRRYDYLRLSVTDRCNLACIYCMPPGGEEDHGVRRELLTFEEAARLAAAFAEGGVRRVRLTGGEPLVRKDAVRMVERISERAAVEPVMTTNATRLGELAGPLRRAGLRGVNVSFDTLDPERFRETTRGGEIGPVMAGLRAAIDAGLEVKLNIVAMKGVNDHELGRLVDFAWELGATPRFIELMPLGEAAKLPRDTGLATGAVLARLGGRVADGTRRGVPGQGPARYLEAADGSGRRVGFISAMTDNFCDACNRVRITARGDLRPCLASRRAVSLRDVMRNGGSDADLAWGIHWALSGKDDGHYFRDAVETEHEHVGMSLIGG